MDEQMGPGAPDGGAVAAGLPADWLNGWLAALGVTVLIPRVRLDWTADPRPRARFELAPGDPGDGAAAGGAEGVGLADVAESVAATLPTVETLEGWALADLPQKITVDLYRRAARTAREAVAQGRSEPNPAVLATDLARDRRKHELATGPFNVGAPRGETLHDRLVRCRRELDGAAGGDDLVTRVHASLDGRGRRAPVNGLGFDYTRLAGSVPGEAEKYADPVVEVLAFHGLLLHPMVGDGRVPGQRGRLPRQRGWTARPAREHAFRWPVWQGALDRWGIDALLDVVYAETVPQAANGPDQRQVPSRLGRAGVMAIYGSVPFRQTGQSDPTRGYASRKLWPSNR